jgi:hypothetical protein
MIGRGFNGMSPQTARSHPEPVGEAWGRYMGLRQARRAAAILACLVGLASNRPAAIAFDPPSPDPAGNVLTLEVYVRNDNDDSRRAAAFAGQLAQTHSGLRVMVYDVLNESQARARFWDLCSQFKVAKPGVPAFFACNQAHYGFSSAEKSGRAIEKFFAIRAFVRPGCMHCRDAKQFLAGLQRRWPAVRVELLDIVADPMAQQKLTDVTNKYQAQVSALPAIELCNRFVVGYDSDATTGAHIENILRQASVPSSLRAQSEPRPERSARRDDRRAGERGRLRVDFVSLGRQQPEASAHSEADVPPLPPVAEEDTTAATAPPPPPIEGIEIPGWGILSVGDLGLPAFTFVIGLVDGFNPCAMWVLVFLLSILVNVRNRAKIIAIAGTFVVVSGLAYFTFMAAWLNVFLLIGYMRPLQIALGMLAVVIGVVNVKDFVAFKQGVTLSIPESAKEGIYARVRAIVAARYLGAAVAMAVVLAISVNIVELLCTAGLPALYTQILTVQQLPAWQNYAYLLLYNLAYMLDDALMLGVFVATLSHRKMQEREGRWLKLASGVVILALGVVMLFRPQWLELADLGYDL